MFKQNSPYYDSIEYVFIIFRKINNNFVIFLFENIFLDLLIYNSTLEVLSLF